MGKRIVVLMEGSGNAFDSAPSNVTRMLQLIALGPVARGDVEQRAIWDYGVGTRLRDLDEKTVQGAQAFQGVDASRLEVLDPPRRPRWMPRPLAKYAGLAFGFGLAENVAEAVEALARCHKPTDELFLLGFSRGAFTVRVLAALLWRFGLPVVFLACCFPILLNTYGGVRGIDPVLIDTGRTFGIGRMKALWQIILPASMPNILTGMRISLGIALIVAVVAEMITGNSGIGYFILDMQRIFRVPEMFAGIFTLGLLGFFINFIFLRIEGHFLRWRGTSVET